MASGKHQKNQVIAKFRYTLGGISECGLEYQYNFGTFEPDFGDGFVPQIADDQVSRDHNVPVGSLGFEPERVAPIDAATTQAIASHCSGDRCSWRTTMAASAAAARSGASHIH